MKGYLQSARKCEKTCKAAADTEYLISIAVYFLIWDAKCLPLWLDTALVNLRMAFWWLMFWIMAWLNQTQLFFSPTRYLWRFLSPRFNEPAIIGCFWTALGKYCIFQLVFFSPYFKGTLFLAVWFLRSVNNPPLKCQGLGGFTWLRVLALFVSVHD